MLIWVYLCSSAEGYVLQQLSGLDASFLYLESPRSPMHVGGLYLLDASKAGEDFGYDKFFSLIESRLHVARIFRQRLVEVPMGLGHPFWIEDPDFDLHVHVPRIGAPRPGGKEELMRLAANLFGKPLNRSRPLWETTFVDGVDNFPGLSKGSFAYISRVHHAAIDGMSGAEIMGALLDVEPAPAAVGHEDNWEDDWEPESIPGAAELIARSSAKLRRTPAELARFVGEVAGGAGKLAVGSISRQFRLKPPTLPMRAPRTRLNRTVRAQRNFGGVEFDLQRIKDLRSKVEGATVNDVVLAVCAGALRTYLTEHDELPDKELIAMAPISVRDPKRKGSMGNQVSAMLVALATDSDDPIERLQRIHANTTSSKAYSSAIPANKLIEFVPSAVASQASRLYTRMQVADKHAPFFNLIITNVPGPPTPLYMAGARLHGGFGMAPVFDGLGMILVVTSMAGKMTISITACARAMPDVELFEDCLLESLIELEAAEQETAPTTRGGPANKLRATMDELSLTINRMQEEE